MASTNWKGPPRKGGKPRPNTAPMSPSRAERRIVVLLDEVGIDVGDKVGKIMVDAFGDR